MLMACQNSVSEALTPCCTLYNDISQNCIIKYGTAIGASCVGADCTKVITVISLHSYQRHVLTHSQSGGQSMHNRPVSAGTNVNLQQTDRQTDTSVNTCRTVYGTHDTSHAYLLHSGWPSCHFHCARSAASLWYVQVGGPLLPQPRPWHQTYLRQTQCTEIYIYIYISWIQCQLTGCWIWNKSSTTNINDNHNQQPNTQFFTLYRKIYNIKDIKYKV
jgi:hypothetical protein